MSLDFPRFQVFLNYPFDGNAESISLAMHFAVASAGLLPVCAWDLTSPDRSRLSVLETAISSCQYSLHDLSTSTNENESPRLNVPFELGGVLFQALRNQNQGHRCAFFVTSSSALNKSFSDLAGMDPLLYDTDTALLVKTYEWLRDTVHAAFNPRPSVDVADLYARLKRDLMRLRGSGRNGRPTHNEAQEVMYRIAAESGLWDWRVIRAGQLAFPELPLAWAE